MQLIHTFWEINLYTYTYLKLYCSVFLLTLLLRLVKFSSEQTFVQNKFGLSHKFFDLDFLTKFLLSSPIALNPSSLPSNAKKIATNL